MKFILVFLVVLGFFGSTVYGFCFWKKPGTLKVCMKENYKECEKFESSDRCEALEEEFKSGYTIGGAYKCVIYKSKKCEGRFVSVNKKGWQTFPFRPRSFRCECYIES